MEENVSFFGFCLIMVSIVLLPPLWFFGNKILSILTLPSTTSMGFDHTLIVEEEPPDFSRIIKYQKLRDRN
jgi:hypothetical protein